MLAQLWMIILQSWATSGLKGLVLTPSAREGEDWGFPSQRTKRRRTTTGRPRPWTSPPRSPPPRTPPTPRRLCSTPPRWRPRRRCTTTSCGPTRSRPRRCWRGASSSWTSTWTGCPPPAASTPRPSPRPRRRWPRPMRPRRRAPRWQGGWACRRACGWSRQRPRQPGCTRPATCSPGPRAGRAAGRCGRRRWRRGGGPRRGTRTGGQWINRSCCTPGSWWRAGRRWWRASWRRRRRRTGGQALMPPPRCRTGLLNS
mmetsp:Transcript_30080/g.49002  ORF Transcript_30080/g.49002 Transcript_30080/m.49002 type:complete len:256 (-) Transcript_30080:1293-2060(-)